MAKRTKAPEAPKTLEQIRADQVEKQETLFKAALPLAQVPTRSFAVGDPIRLGGLKDPVILWVSEDKRLYQIEYTNVAYGRDTGRVTNVFSWHSVFAAEGDDVLGLEPPSRRLLYFTQHDVGSLVHRASHRGIFCNPEYQRGYVWTDVDRDALIANIFLGREIGKFVFLEHPFPEHRLEILDGQQRLTTILNFVYGHYRYKGFTFAELSQFERNRFEAGMVQTCDIDSSLVTKKDIVKMFLDLNCGGVPQTEEHLSKVRALYESL